MSLLRLSLFPLWGALLLHPWGALSAQESSVCLRPLLDGTSPGSAIRGAPPEKAPSHYFLSSEGRLCQGFDPTDPGITPPQSIEERPPTPGRAFLLSAVIPGAGQKRLGQHRWVAYVATEVWAWIQYSGRRREGMQLQERYRDLAWLVARRVSTGPRVDGNFEYYETMTKYQASGAYDTNPDEGGLQPEEDPETFNGSIWALAREIFFLDDPATPIDVNSDHYQDALRYYSSRAYAPNRAWNWSDNTLQQAEFSELIRLSDENLRRGTTMVGVIIANHILSSVDALVSSRLLQEAGREPLIELSLLPGPVHQDALVLSVRIPTR